MHFFLFKRLTLRIAARPLLSLSGFVYALLGKRVSVRFVLHETRKREGLRRYGCDACRISILCVGSTPKVDICTPRVRAGSVVGGCSGPYRVLSWIKQALASHSSLTAVSEWSAIFGSDPDLNHTGRTGEAMKA